MKRWERRVGEASELERADSSELERSAASKQTSVLVTLDKLEPNIVLEMHDTSVHCCPDENESNQLTAASQVSLRGSGPSGCEPLGPGADRSFQIPARRPPLLPRACCPASYSTSPDMRCLKTGVNDGRVLMFATDRNLELLAASDTIFSDGTFKTVPNQFFQLFTVQGIVGSFHKINDFEKRREEKRREEKRREEKRREEKRRRLKIHERGGVEGEWWGKRSKRNMKQADLGDTSIIKSNLVQTQNSIFYVIFRGTHIRVAIYGVPVARHGRFEPGKRPHFISSGNSPQLSNGTVLQEAQRSFQRLVRLTLRVLLAIKASQIEEAVAALDRDMVDVLMKYVYRGFESPSEGSSGHLLLWHEKAYVVGSVGSIMRVLSDTKRA
ncbi:hypothetical protein ANN_21878 [Periplaneta americana]|uniref:Actin-related protein 2/3 complex subunit 5 n=1 Tax=Periplaneta americana TaxID=6978 RepID=A0ABQ8S6Y4_PERAM|nr:hypothetical protein ANN_21878 [Periplaneta americana]